MDRFLILGTCRQCSIPWTVIAPHEEQALINHGQSLEKLNSRGGLSWGETLAVLEDREYKKLDEKKDRKLVENIVAKATVATICTVKMLKDEMGEDVEINGVIIDSLKTEIFKKETATNE